MPETSRALDLLTRIEEQAPKENQRLQNSVAALRANLRGEEETCLMPDGRPRPQSPDEWRAYLEGVSGSWADLDFVEPEDLPYESERSVG